MQDENIELLWTKFSDFNVDADDCITQEFEHFDIGTSKFDVWAWFDEKHSKGVVYLQGLTE